MKLSETHIGDILVMNHTIGQGKTYCVITDMETVLIGMDNRIVFNLKNCYIGKEITTDTIFISDGLGFFLLNETTIYLSFTLDDFRKDLFPHPYHISKNFEASVIPHDDMPLLIDIENKTEWFERALNKEVENHGQNIYDLMKDALTEKNAFLS